MPNLKELLVEKKISPSLHRLKILDYIRKPHTHPSVDEIFHALEKEIPTLSKTTVYNTLRLFSEKELVVALTILDNEVRYEFKTSKHEHFFCEKCGNIYDIDYTFENVEDQTIENHYVRSQFVYLRGICKKCLEKESNA